MKQLISTAFYILIIVSSFGQTRRINVKIDLTSCFDGRPIDCFGYLIHDKDSIYLRESARWINIENNVKYNLYLITERFREPYKSSFTFKVSDSIFLFKAYMGDSIPIEKLETSEIDAQHDIEQGKMKIFMYGAFLSDTLSSLAWKYGQPETTLNSVAIKYNFEFVYTGCEVYESRTRGFTRYNKRILKELNSRNQKGWIRKFEKEVIRKEIKRRPFRKRLYYRLNKKALILNKV